jgi:DNA-binding NtrC family response regulator
LLAGCTRKVSPVVKHVLLIEPYDMIADVIVEILEQLDYEVDVGNSGTLTENDLRARDYHCVLINLDQNASGWRDKGLVLAEFASNVGLPVVMIPDHETATATIEAKGWLHFQKPFSVRDIEDVLLRARSGKPQVSGISPLKEGSEPTGAPLTS